MKAKWVNIVDSLQGNVDGRERDRYIEISRNRYIEQRAEISTYRDIDISKRKEKSIKQIITIFNTIKYYAEDTAIWIFLVEYLGGGECYSIGDSGVLQEISEPEE
jgi:hypothetical protein